MGLFKHGPSDYPSYLLWFLDETHITVTAGTAAVILYTRKAHAVYFAAGAVGSTLVARVVKHMVRQPRPPPPDSTSKPSPVRPKRTYGMPSTHSTALGFYFFYLWPLLPLITHSTLGTVAESVVLTAVTGLGIWSRVELGYHTIAQVLVGATVGAVSALAWSALWTAYPQIEVQLQDVIDACVKMVM